MPLVMAINMEILDGTVLDGILTDHKLLLLHRDLMDLSHGSSNSIRALWLETTQLHFTDQQLALLVLQAMDNHLFNQVQLMVVSLLPQVKLSAQLQLNSLDQLQVNSLHQPNHSQQDQLLLQLHMPDQ